MTFSKDNTRYEYNVFSRNKQVAAVTECTRRCCGGLQSFFLLLQGGNFLRVLESSLRLDPSRCKNFFTVRS